MLQKQIFRCKFHGPSRTWPRTASGPRTTVYFNVRHVLQLWSETIAFHRRMIYGSHMKNGRMWPKSSDICLMVEGKPRKTPQPGNWPDQSSNPGPLRGRQRCYPLTTAVLTIFWEYCSKLLELGTWIFVQSTAVVCYINKKVSSHYLDWATLDILICQFY